MKDLAVNVGGLVLAAGQSRRMGRPKMTMTWGKTTVIELVTQTLLQGGANPVVAVTGGARREVEEALRELPVSTIYNPEYETGEMISSVRVGLQAFDEHTAAVLIAMGDQPQIQAETIGALIRVYRDNRAPLIVPSYQMRRGHPWLVSRELWQEIIDLHPPQTLRDFLERQAANIQYLVVDTASVLQDIDTPEQYEQYRPE